jgi:hypothetical protein
MVSVPLLPQPRNSILHCPFPLLIPSGRWLQAEVFSFPLAFVFLDAHYTLLCAVPLSLVYPDFVLQNGTFGCGLFGQLCVWLLEI